MNTLRHKRRLLPGPAFWLLVPFCALAFLTRPSSAETLRAELYQFQLPGSVGQSGQADPQVYLRVSNADRLISNPAAPFEPRPAEGTSHFALFEFFLGPDQSGLSVSRVRFHTSDQSQAPFSKLHAILSSGIAGPLASPAKALSTADGYTVDFPHQSPTRTAGPGQVVGLMFELAPTESVHSLIGARLRTGQVRPEVEVRLPGGGSVWASVLRPIELIPGLPRGGSQVLAASSCPPISTIPRTNLAAVHTRTTLLRDHKRASSVDHLTRKAPSLMLESLRARAPPALALLAS